jgi:hypothetical protein
VTTPAAYRIAEVITPGVCLRHQETALVVSRYLPEVAISLSSGYCAHQRCDQEQFVLWVTYLSADQPLVEICAVSGQLAVAVAISPVYCCLVETVLAVLVQAEVKQLSFDVWLGTFRVHDWTSPVLEVFVPVADSVPPGE